MSFIKVFATFSWFAGQKFNKFIKFKNLIMRAKVINIDTKISSNIKKNDFWKHKFKNLTFKCTLIVQTIIWMPLV